MRLATPLLIFSLLSIGCSKVVRPNADLKYVNAPASRLEGYNALEDYDDNGVRKADAKLRTWPMTTFTDASGVVWIKGSELNGWLCLDPHSQEEIKSYIGRARDAYKECQAK